jgi:hypothetical protein
MAKVRDLQTPSVGEKEVLGLEVAVRDALLVKVMNTA